MNAPRTALIECPRVRAGRFHANVERRFEMFNSMHSLESRRLLAAAVLNSTTGLLGVTGTTAADTIALSVAGSNIVVKVNAGAAQSFAASATKAIRVSALA